MSEAPLYLHLVDEYGYPVVHFWEAHHDSATFGKHIIDSRKPTIGHFGLTNRPLLRSTSLILGYLHLVDEDGCPVVRIFRSVHTLDPRKATFGKQIIDF